MAVVVRSALLDVPVDAVYRVVIDVARYPEFLPACEAVEVLEQTVAGLVARVTVASRGLRESFVTNNVHREGDSVAMSLQEGPFEYLEGLWRFTALGDMGCRVDLQVDFKPRGVLARILGRLADRVADNMVDAFTQRVRTVYHSQTP